MSQTQLLSESEVPPPDIFTIHKDGHVLVTLRPDGTLVYGDGYDPDAAARIFWEALRNHRP